MSEGFTFDQRIGVSDQRHWNPCRSNFTLPGWQSVVRVRKGEERPIRFCG